MVWTVDMDDFSGSACGSDVKYPLIGAMRQERTTMYIEVQNILLTFKKIKNSHIWQTI